MTQERADAMAKEPSALVGHFQGAVHLVGANALLAAAHKVDGLQPLVERNVAFLKNGAHADGELAFAVRALVEAVALNALWVLLRGLGADASQLVGLLY